MANAATVFADMQSHEVLKEVLKQTSAKQIAADMNLSLSLIYKWTESSDETGSGASNPLDRVDQLLKSTGDRRIAQWVCERAGGFFISNPEYQKAHAYPLIPMTNKIVQEFADMLAVIATAAADSTITKEEAKQIRRRWEELKSVTEGFVHAAENGNFGALKNELEDKTR